jgi:hypothetical protein
MNSIEKLSGTYAGSGCWHDALGQSQSYTIEQTNRVTADGFEIVFKHEFEDGSVVKAHFALITIAPNILRLEMSGAAVGNAYVLDDYCHYCLKVGDAFVEATYRITNSGLAVFGSSTKNADGNFIAWHEKLARHSA